MIAVTVLPAEPFSFKKVYFMLIQSIFKSTKTKIYTNKVNKCKIQDDVEATHDRTTRDADGNQPDSCDW